MIDLVAIFFAAYVFFIGVTIGMVILKLIGVLLVSWWCVFSPLILVALFVGATFLAFDYGIKSWSHL